MSELVKDREELSLSAMKKTYRDISLRLLGVWIFTTALGMGADYAAYRFCGDFYYTAEFSYLMTVVINYLIELPLVAWLLHKFPKKSTAFVRLPADRLAVLTLISFFFLIAGSLVSQLLASVINSMFGTSFLEADVSALIAESELWEVFLVVTVLGPIMEELLFRKILLDALLPWGENTAILYSAILFGLWHEDLFQIVYAFLVGLLLGYLRVKSGRMKYNILLHMLINFCGSFLILLLTELNNLFYILEYEMLYYGLGVAGLVLFILEAVRLSSERKILLYPDQTRAAFKNIGFILLCVLCVGWMIFWMVMEARGA